MSNDVDIINDAPEQKRPAFEIVLRAIQTYEGRLVVTLPNSMKIGWAQNRLCEVIEVWHDAANVSQPPDEERWVECSIPFNVFVDLCEQMTEEQIFDIIYLNVLSR